MRKKMDSILGWLVSFLMAVMVLNVLWQVASRYLIGVPSVFTDELANFLLIWVGLLGTAYATSKKLHLAIEIVPSRLSGVKRQRLTVVIAAFVILFALAVMVIGGARLVYLTLVLEQLSPSLQVPLGYVYVVIPISGLLIIYYSIDNLKTTENGVD